MHVPPTEITVTLGGECIALQLSNEGEYLIGSDAGCDIVVPGEWVSARHAKLTVSFHELLIDDLGSEAGTFIAGKRVTESTRLWPGQTVQIGDATINTQRLRSDEPGDSLMPWSAELRRHLPASLLKEERYAINSLVAQGGMGAILEAQDQTIRRTVAMKVMLDPRFQDDMVRFIEEAQLTGQLEHPNIVPIYELGVDAHEQVFYTMKFVRGITLQQVIDGLAAGEVSVGKKFSLAALVTHFQKVCDAVAFAHSRGVIHRDLKPENVMLGDFGEVLVMDWGLAKQTKDQGGMMRSEKGGAAASSSANNDAAPIPAGTMSGSVLGTPNFMAPEQAQGRAQDVNERTDIFALGGILYSMLTLQMPFTGETVEEILSKVINGKLTPPPGTIAHLPGGRLPDSLRAVALKALAANPGDRYQTVAALQQDIEAYQGGFATRAERANVFKQTGLLVRRHKRAFAVAGAAWAIIVGLGVWFLVKVTASERLADHHRRLAVAERNRAEGTLEQLKETAPIFYQQARALIEERKFADALRTVDYAISLAPEQAAYVALRGNILQSLFRFSEARVAFEAALQLDPACPSASNNVDLSQQLGADLRVGESLSSPSHRRFYEALLAQGRRSEAASLLEAVPSDALAAQKAFSFWKRQLAAAGENAGCLKLYDGYRLGADLKGAGVTDIRFLKDVPLVKLDINWTGVSDLSPLVGMPLEELNITGSPVRDLGPLRGMQLRVLLAEKTPVSDLAPLRGIPLRHLNLGDTRVTDFTALKGMPLERFEVSLMKVNDLSFLRGAPLTVLYARNCPVTDLAPLAGMALTELRINGGEFSSLEPLRGMPLRVLGITNTKVTDLSPLREMPLEEVEMEALPLEDLAIFEGKALTRLDIPRTKVRDLSMLRGMPLKHLDLRGCVRVVDLSPLKDCLHLEELILPRGVSEIAFARELPNLQRLSYEAEQASFERPRQTVAQFWKEYDAARPSPVQMGSSPVSESPFGAGVRGVK